MICHQIWKISLELECDNLKSMKTANFSWNKVRRVLDKRSRLPLTIKFIWSWTFRATMSKIQTKNHHSKTKNRPNFEFVPNLTNTGDQYSAKRKRKSRSTKWRSMTEPQDWVEFYSFLDLWGAEGHHSQGIGDDVQPSSSKAARASAAFWGRDRGRGWTLWQKLVNYTYVFFWKLPIQKLN